MSPDVNEILLHEDNKILEGLSSNFFAVYANGTLATAPSDKVLGGTVRKVILAVCKEHEIPVILEAPDIRNVDQWQGALISSKCFINFFANRD
jgi:branched-subunit amino acid aminotransferase/4-amino-4-deoxychorismate lyase